MRYTFHDLDRVSDAFEQRAVPLAFGRFIFVLGVLWLVIGLWPPSRIDFALIGSLPMIVGILVSIAYRSPSRNWIVWVGGLITILVALNLVLNSILVLTHFDRIISPVPVGDDLERAIAIANEMYYDRFPWKAGRIVSLLLGLSVGIELFAAGFLLLRLSPDERCLLNEDGSDLITSSLSWILEIPLGIIRYSKGARQWIGLYIIALVFFFLALTNIAGANQIQNYASIVRVSACIDDPRGIHGCLERAGFIHAIGMTVFLGLGSLFFLPLVGSSIARFVRTQLGKTATERLNEEQDSPGKILFLRSVYDDSVALPAPRFTPMRFALSPSARMKPDLDYLLVAEFMGYGMPYGMGLPDRRPFGAMRLVVPDDPSVPTSEQPWFLKFKDMAREAQRIVIVIGENIFDPQRSEGLRLELKHLTQEPELLAKTTILVKSGSSEQLWEHIIRGIGDEELKRELSELEIFKISKPLIALSFTPNREAHAFIASRFSYTTALITLRAVLRSTTEERISLPS